MTELEMARRADLVAGLRGLADALESDVSMPLPYSKDFSVPLSTNGAVEEFAAGRGMTVVYDGEGNARAEIELGPVSYYVYGYRDFDEHCERRAERDARRWAESKGLEIRPVDAEAVAL